ncbi:DUF3054 domain-containing protein [Natrialbaceae archaeon AArc-T1-2]|uniref:DUF3054 domain-containing protein n=1 Tax=Natrialbaceae archaeon AArc-T1-2 TaxID=3053904 RepID=UPI00255A92A3|nr:DUF3054 domain-containing protein [Natrialbaceae archaeon AArc-T1-2]WIV66004.1 DUF3054 domain-containing protein [Natrialbaceae archaeon AArc-T1-2]
MLETERALEVGPRCRESVLVGVVDVGLLAGLILFGQLSHGLNPIAEPIGALETILPFLIGWIIAAPLAGVYAQAALASPWLGARVTAVGWLAAANVGFVLRSSPAFEGGIAWAFPLVMSGFGLIVLVGWRIGYATAAGD